MAHRIRVLHMITRLIVGGAQQNTAYTSIHLDRSKYEVEVLVGPSIEKGGGELITGIRESGIIVHDLPELTTPIHPLKDPIALWKTYRFLKKNRFDIIHTHSSKAGILGRLAAKMTGVPIIVHTVHGWGFRDSDKNALRVKIFIWLEKIVSPMTNMFIAVTKMDVQKSERFKIAPADKFWVIRSGIEISRFADVKVDVTKKREDLNIPNGRKVICWIGRFAYPKAPEDAIKVAKQVVQKVPDCVFLLVGDGPDRPIIESMMEEYGLKEHVILTGLRDDVPEILAITDIFLLSSHSEGLPRVLPQAMAASKPIVSTRVGGTYEAVEDGVNGFLAEYGDIEQLAEKVVYLLQNSDIAFKMGLEGRKRVDPEFSAQEMVRKIDELYQILLQKRAGR